MLVFPLAAAALTYSQRHRFDSDKRPIIFALELVATWIFSAYWLLKSLEIRGTQANRTTLKHHNT
jgi:hypothetical protein